MFDASYLSDRAERVYLGAPVAATPLDPASSSGDHQSTTRRTGRRRLRNLEDRPGAYHCVYGMRGKDRGYQFIGRTLQMWNRYHGSPTSPVNHESTLRKSSTMRFLQFCRGTATDPPRFSLALIRCAVTSTLRLAGTSSFLQPGKRWYRRFRQHQQRAFNDGTRTLDSQRPGAFSIAGKSRLTQVSRRRCSGQQGDGSHDLRQSVSAGRREVMCAPATF